MKTKSAPEKRTYKQGARAEAAEATGHRITAAFLTRAETEWFDEITLESLAQDAGVTVQTLIRRFGGKDGVVDAASASFEVDVITQRQCERGDVKRAIEGLIGDYERAGGFVMRMLAQEDRYASIKRVTDKGRAGHRKWLGEVFTPWLESLTPKAREARLDALVAATDIFLWRLVRNDMGRDVSAYRKLMQQLIAGALDGEKPWEKAK
jgi:AcrR family transcriptional regulator